MNHPPDSLRTDELSRLCSVPVEKRDGKWVAEFLENLPDAALAGAEPPIVSVHGFPYFQLRIPPRKTPFSAYTVRYLIEPCLQREIGIGIFGNSRLPEWSLSFGDLTSFRFYENFLGDPDDRVESRIRHLYKSTEVTISEPSDTLLPPMVRKAIFRFLKENSSVPDPRVALYVDPQRVPLRNLIFNVYPEHAPGPGAYANVMKGIAWYLPKGRGLLQGNPFLVKPDRYFPLLRP